MDEYFAINASFSPLFTVLFYGGTTLALLIIWRIIRYYRTLVLIPVFESNKKHNYNVIDVWSHSVYCSICEDLIADGMYCDFCGICCDKQCVTKADQTLHCKQSSTSISENFECQWIRGNLPLHSVCFVCGEDCGDETSLKDYRCCWCQRAVHEEERCFKKVKKRECDFGHWASCIIPPFAIKTKYIWYNGKRKLIVDSLNEIETSSDWRPLVVITNRKSGNNDGHKILRAFHYLLNPAQVIDLSESPLETALEWCQMLEKYEKNVKVRILIAGGDGTIGWVLNAIEKLKLDPKPLIAILPLGTGNDLSRVLGWGTSFSPDTQMKDVLRNLQTASVTELDRWEVKFSHLRRSFSLPLRAKSLYMNNYFSVGVDALVALNFHQTRESALYRLLGNRILNKFLYLSYGTKDVLERKCSLLNEKIRLFMDGKRIELPQLESIVVLNIPSWGGGANIWSLGHGGDTAPLQLINDQKVEVLGLYSSFHIGQLMIGLSEPLRFGQASIVTIELLDNLPVEVDGEPFLQSPTNISISWCSKASMLVTKDNLLYM
ncbi:diacylglycerol kinase epsilon-like protein [Leptotrombidium deliense]|uniref:Diacylglycerol kinase n=1 Tax=Leptotrombidium deliense TaxID=299467 RepID=A0A443SQC2_9ACAR|nr:diacylglycerol kinase epsilon-like protein [Leptotrombidium deliense]